MLIFVLLMILGLINLSDGAVGFSADDNCNWEKCAVAFNVVPVCGGIESDAVRCLRDAFNACPTGIVIEHELNAFQLSEKVLCNDAQMAADMQRNPDCWKYALKCAAPLVINQNFVYPETCGEKKTDLELCKNDSAVPEDCRPLHWEFSDGVFNASTCGAATIIIQVSVIVVASLLSLASRVIR